MQTAEKAKVSETRIQEERDEIQEERDEIASVLAYLEKTLMGKNSDYGNSIFHSPMLCPNVHPLQALECRLSDKIGRYINLRNKERLSNMLRNIVYNESKEDTVLDMAGYCVLILTYLRLEKKREERHQRLQEEYDETHRC